MFYPLSTDYIKYLNDPECYGLNYDQWKDKKMRQKLQKQGNKKRPFNGITKYNY